MNREDTNFYRDVCSRMKIDKHRLDDELEVQAETLHKISQKLTDAKRAMDVAEEELDNEEAQAFIEVSDMHRARKVNLDYIKKQVHSDSKYRAKWISYNERRTDWEKWDHLYQSWKQRSYALTSLSELAMANYYAVDSTYQRGGDRVPQRRSRER